MKRIRHKFVVAAYEVDKLYGGPEEGGWWYDAWYLTKVLHVYNTKREAVSAKTRLEPLLNRLQRRNPRLIPVSSVAYRGGQFELQVHRIDKIPKSSNNYMQWE